MGEETLTIAQGCPCKIMVTLLKVYPTELGSLSDKVSKDPLLDRAVIYGTDVMKEYVQSFKQTAGRLLTLTNTFGIELEVER